MKPYRWRAKRRASNAHALPASALLATLLAWLALCPPAAAHAADACSFEPAAFEARSATSEPFQPLGPSLSLPPRLKPTTTQVRFQLPPVDRDCWLLIDRVSLYGLTVRVDDRAPRHFNFFRPGPDDRVAAAGYALPLPRHAQPSWVTLEVTQLGVLSTRANRVELTELLVQERRISALHALSLLVPLFMALLTALFWFRLRDRALAAYVGLLATLILVTASLDGTLYLLPIGALFAGMLSMAHIFLLSLFGLAVTVFSREFLAPLDRSGERTFRCLAAAFAFTGASSLLGIPVYSAVIQHVTTFSLMVAVPLLLWQGLRSLRAGHPSAPYFLVGWSIPLLVIPLRLLAEYGVIEWGFWIRYAPRIGFMFEALVFALGLADRVLRVRIERDRAEQERLRSERALDGYRRLAEADSLTGLASRRALEGALQRWDLDRQRGSVLFMDLDHFKDFNDRHGHAEGDAALRAVAARLRELLPAPAHLARYGGEELVGLLPDCDGAAAQALAERIRHDVEHHVAGPDGRTVTLSIGIAQRHPAEPMTQTLARADAALYRAKAAGRNRVALG